MGTFGNGKEKSVRKEPVGEGRISYDAPFRGYVNINLTPEQKGDFDRWSGEQGPWDTLEEQVGMGVNIALKLDPKGDGFLASATQRRVGSPNAGLVVTARGRTAATAWLRVLFCLHVLAMKPKWEDTQPVSDPDRW